MSVNKLLEKEDVLCTHTSKCYHAIGKVVLPCNVSGIEGTMLSEKSHTERQILHGITYMRILKKKKKSNSQKQSKKNGFQGVGDGEIRETHKKFQLSEDSDLRV